MVMVVLSDDNVRIGIAGDNEIDTIQNGNLTIDSAGGTVTVDDQFAVTGCVLHLLVR